MSSNLKHDLRLHAMTCDEALAEVKDESLHQGPYTPRLEAALNCKS